MTTRTIKTSAVRVGDVLAKNGLRVTAAAASGIRGRKGKVDVLDTYVSTQCGARMHRQARSDGTTVYVTIPD
jgi:hypothetical protein